MNEKTILKAPFPWFGGKSRAADLIWSRLGNPQNYVEPFAGSLAVLLQRPHTPKTETVNDLDGFVANAWRSITFHPDEVAFHADYPVLETDLHARHAHLVRIRGDLTARLEGDPSYCDPMLAGWWIWGACLWIGSGWCNGTGGWVVENGRLIRAKQGEFAGDARKLPHLGDSGKGVQRQLPHLGNSGTGVTRPGISRQMPHVSDAGTGDARSSVHGSGVYEWMHQLSQRLRRVRVCCGDWSRVVTPSVTTKHGITGVLLDPPYSDTGNDTDVYGIADSHGLSALVRQWALDNGRDPLLRVALCGYDGEHNELERHGWTVEAWRAAKGYQGDTVNTRRERVWFSPNCLAPAARGLFEMEQPL